MCTSLALASLAWRLGLMCTSLAQRVPRLAPRANVYLAGARGPRLAPRANVGTSLAQRGPRLAPRANVGTSLAQRGPRLAPRANVYLAGARGPRLAPRASVGTSLALAALAWRLGLVWVPRWRSRPSPSASG
jgi:hypothetical protein